MIASNGTITVARLARGFLPAFQPPGAAERLLASHARTFHLAARFLPPDRRPAVVTLYAFFRTLDDLVDESLHPGRVDAIRALLDAWRRWLSYPCLAAAPPEPLGEQLAGVIERYQIPRRYVLDLIDGVESDLDPRALADYAELRHYAYQVAGTVGLSLAHVLGATSPPALRAAEDLGVAMQLTNILRDVGEDLLQGRVYIPADDLARFDLSIPALLSLRGSGGPDERFRALMRFQIARARAYYTRGMVGIWLLPDECRLPILVAARLYRRILTVIERNGYDALRRRAVTTRRDKAREVLVAAALDALCRLDERSAPDDAAHSARV